MDAGNTLRGSIVVLVLASLAGCGGDHEPWKADTVAGLRGTASVIDGDTIEIHGKRVRLSGIDAPEKGKRCGQVNAYQQAALALSRMIGTVTVSCEILYVDKYGRQVGRCEAGGVGLERGMVRAGWARDWARYSGGEFAGDEQAARQAGAGVWGMACPDDLWSGRDYE